MWVTLSLCDSPLELFSRLVLPRTFMFCFLHRVIQCPRIGFYMFPRAVPPSAFSVVPPLLLYLLFNLETTIQIFQGIASFFCDQTMKSFSNLAQTTTNYPSEDVLKGSVVTSQAQARHKETIPLYLEARKGAIYPYLEAHKSPQKPVSGLPVQFCFCSEPLFETGCSEPMFQQPTPRSQRSCGDLNSTQRNKLPTNLEAVNRSQRLVTVTRCSR